MTECNKCEKISELVYIGAVIMIMAFFAAWISMDLSSSLGIKFDVAGTTMMTSDFDDKGLFDYTPLIVCILGILIFVFSAVSECKPNTKKIMGILNIVIAIVAIALSAYFMVDDVFDASYSSFGYGIYLSIVGSAIVLIIAAYETYKAFKS